MVSSLPQNTVRKEKTGTERVYGLPKATWLVIVGGRMGFELVFFPFHLPHGNLKHSLDQRSLTFSCQGPYRKYFQLCDPHSLCRNYSIILSIMESSQR